MLHAGSLSLGGAHRAKVRLKHLTRRAPLFNWGFERLAAAGLGGYSGVKRPLRGLPHVTQTPALINPGLPSRHVTGRPEPRAAPSYYYAKWHDRRRDSPGLWWAWQPG